MIVGGGDSCHEIVTARRAGKLLVDAATRRLPAQLQPLLWLYLPARLTDGTTSPSAKGFGCRSPLARPPMAWGSDAGLAADNKRDQSRRGPAKPDGVHQLRTNNRKNVDGTSWRTLA